MTQRELSWRRVVPYKVVQELDSIKLRFFEFKLLSSLLNFVRSPAPTPVRCHYARPCKRSRKMDWLIGLSEDIAVRGHKRYNKVAQTTNSRSLRMKGSFLHGDPTRSL